MEELIEDILKSLNVAAQGNANKPSGCAQSSPWAPFMKIIESNINDVDINELFKNQSKDAQAPGSQTKSSQVPKPEVFTHIFHDLKDNLQSNSNSFQVDMFKDTDGVIHIIADVPGVDKSDVDLNVSSSTPVIEISIKKPNISDIVKTAGTVLKNERKKGKLTRSILLPKESNLDSIAATCEKGVLHVTVNTKPASTDFRKVQVQ